MRQYIRWLVLAACVVPAFGIPAAAGPSRDVEAGLAALRAGRLEEAGAALSRARFDAPADPRIAYDLGIVAYHERRYETAAAEFASVASNSASHPGLVSDALHNLGNACFRAGDDMRAIEAYQAALARREDPETRYNLEQAQKRLAERQQAEQAGQGGDGKKSGSEDRQQQQGEQQQDGQQDGQRQSGQKSDSQAGNQDGENREGQGDGQGGQDGKQRQAEQPSGTASGTEKRQAEAAPGENASGTRQAEEPPQNRQANASEPAAPNVASASEQAPWSGQDAKLRDVKLDPASQAAKDVPDASQRARALKNQKINPYMIERLLRQMEEREKEVQRRYRRDPSERDRGDPFDDPFFMDPERMREFMEGRRGQPRKPEGDTPDW